MSKYESNDRISRQPMTTAQQLEVAAHWLDEAEMLAANHNHGSMLQNFRRVARDCRKAAESST